MAALDLNCRRSGCSHRRPKLAICLAPKSVIGVQTRRSVSGKQLTEEEIQCGLRGQIFLAISGTIGAGAFFFKGLGG
jgi:hypothetical protein